MGGRTKKNERKKLRQALEVSLPINSLFVCSCVWGFCFLFFLLFCFLMVLDKAPVHLTQCTEFTELPTIFLLR